ncbi:hypothetical protein GALMADRAFT_217309 [Galerina marginata CBS 339.88]|uniref:Uncharacterized protein n=1 Tax=Galerina marginata (strain CBS 339.88) TaxID=685588 RepID=A0A067SGT4_GALM3|nr:hypothetical protein GALMADRAFT_217309 [Galerina marginata CBS 339.88]
MLYLTPLLACCWVFSVLAASSNLANDILDAPADQLVNRPTATLATVASASATAPSGFQTPDPKFGNWVCVQPALRLFLKYMQSITIIAEDGWPGRVECLERFQRRWQLIGFL